jgi:CBS domain-containing protein
MVTFAETPVRDVMSTHIVTIRSTQPLSDALDQLRLTGLRHLVVVDEASACAGVVSDRTLAAVWPGEVISGLPRSVGDVLHPRRPFCRPDQTARAAARQMLDEGVDALPVVDGSGEAVGIVTGSDLLRLLATSEDVLAVGGQR